MSNLALSLVSHLTEVSKEYFSSFLSTGLYEESDYELLWEMITRNHMFLSEHARFRTDRKWFDRYKAASYLLGQKLNHQSTTPLGGDCAYIRCENGHIYEDAMIAYGLDNSGTEGKVSVVVRGGGHLHDIHQNHNESLSMAISGGYFQGVMATEFSGRHDTVDKSFWLWADRPQKNGGLYITRPVKRWHLSVINPNFY